MANWNFMTSVLWPHFLGQCHIHHFDIFALSPSQVALDGGSAPHQQSTSQHLELIVSYTHPRAYTHTRAHHTWRATSEFTTRWMLLVSTEVRSPAAFCRSHFAIRGLFVLRKCGPNETSIVGWRRVSHSPDHCWISFWDYLLSCAFCRVCKILIFFKRQNAFMSWSRSVAVVRRRPSHSERLVYIKTSLIWNHNAVWSTTTLGITSPVTSGRHLSKLEKNARQCCLRRLWVEF